MRPWILVIALAYPAVAVFPAPETETGTGDQQKTDNTIVITGTRTSKALTESPVLTEVITRREIEASGAMNAADLLATHPGIIVNPSSAGGTSIQIQGLNGEYTLILIDGHRVIGRSSGNIDLTRFAAGNIERIEIVKGAGSALYGSDAMAGVINIITRRPQKEYEAEVSASYGQLNRVHGKAIVGIKKDSYNTSLTSHFLRRDSYDLDTSDISDTGRSFDEFNLTNRTELFPSKKWQIVTTTGLYLRNQIGVSANGDWPIFDDGKKTDTFSGSIVPTYKISPDSSLKFSGYYALFRDRAERDMRDSNVLDSVEDTGRDFTEAGLQYDTLLFESHLITAGGSGSFELIESDRINGGRGNRHREAVYLQDEWFVLKDPNVVLLPGVRGDFDSQFGQAVTPKLGLRYDPAKALTLRGNYGWGFRAPDFKELLLDFHNPSAGYFVTGNEDLEPERSTHISASADWRPTKNLGFILNVFRNDFDNLITVKYNGASEGTKQYTYTNATKAYTQGGELTISLKINKYLSTKIGYNLLDTFDEVKNRVLEGRAVHQGIVGLNFFHRKWGLEGNIRSRIAGPQTYFPDRGEVTSEPYSLTSMQITKWFGDHIAVFTGVTNLFNAGDVEFLTFEPRLFYGGVRGRY